MRSGRYTRQIIFIGVSICPLFLSAYVSSSTSYRMEFDSVNFGGGLGSSASYKTESTLGEIATGDSNSATYYLHAGYQQMDASSITLSSPDDLTLSEINGLYGAATSGDIEWHVMTDNAAGYSLSVKAGGTPALSSSAGDFDDYSPSAAIPDYAWTVSASAAAFGYTVGGTDTATRFLDNGASCNQVGGTANASTCWDGFSTSNVTVASAASANSPAGATTTVTVKAEVGASANQAAGTYTATIIATATTL